MPKRGQAGSAALALFKAPQPTDRRGPERYGFIPLARPTLRMQASDSLK